MRSHVNYWGSCLTPELTAAPESTMTKDLDVYLLDVGTIVDCACVGQVDYKDPSLLPLGKQ